MTFTIMHTVALVLIVVGLNVQCQTKGECMEGALPFNSELCMAVTAPGTWSDTISSCPFSSTNTFQDRNDEKSNDPDFKVFEELLLKLGVEEVWWLEKDALLYGERIYKSSKFPTWGQIRSPDIKALSYPHTVVPRWKWQNSSNGACMSYDVVGKTLNTRNCWSDDEGLHFPSVCWSLRGRNDGIHDSNCPDGFTTEFGLTLNCNKLVSYKDVGLKPTWVEATSVCSRLGPGVFLLEDVNQNLTTTELGDGCNGEFLPLRHILRYSQLKLIKVHLFQSMNTSNTSEMILMRENSTFNCIMCQTNRRESQSLALRHNLLQTAYLTLTVSNYDSRENQSIVCYTDASTNPFSHSNNNQFHFLIESATSENDVPIVYLQKNAYNDVIFLRLKDGKRIFTNGKKKRRTKIEPNMVALLDISGHRLKTLQISVKFNSSGNYLCTGLNKITLTPMLTEKVSLDLSNDGGHLRYSVLLEAQNFKQDLSSDNMEAIVSSTLAQVLNVTNGVIELKRITNDDLHLLFHITLPPDHRPLSVDESIALNDGFKIISIENTDICSTINVTGVDGQSFELRARKRGVKYSYVYNKCVDFNSFYDCTGDGVEGAFWKLKDEIDVQRLKLGQDCPMIKSTIDVNMTLAEETAIVHKGTTINEDHTQNNVGTTLTTLKFVQIDNITEKSLIDDLNGKTIQRESETESAYFEAGHLISQLSKHPLHSNLLPEVTTLIDSILLGSISASSNTLENLEKIICNMMLDPGTNYVQSFKSTVAILVGDLKNDNPMVGIAFEEKSEGDDSANSIKHLDQNYTKPSTNKTVVRATITQSLIQGNTRLAFIVISKTTAFEAPISNLEIISPILNIILSKDGIATKTFPDNEFIDIMFKPKRKYKSRSGRKICAFWNTEKNMWLEEGCVLHREIDGEMDVCRCNHLTHFAEIITYDTTPISQAHQLALEIISIVGCTISLIGLLIIMLSAAFREWREQLGNQILMSLSAALILNLFSYLLAHGGAGGSDGAGCIIVGVLLHYSLLACFCWMLIMACLQVLRLLTILGTSRINHLLLKASIFGWGVPLTHIFTLLAINYRYYTPTSVMGFSRGFCYPTGMPYYLTVAAPVGGIVVINVVLYFVIMCRICSCFGWGALDSGLQRHGLTGGKVIMRQMKTLTFLFFLLGIVWTIGFLVHYLFFAYVFCIIATLQGFVVFVFFFVVQDSSREHWTNLISEKFGINLENRRNSNDEIE